MFNPGAPATPWSTFVGAVHGSVGEGSVLSLTAPSGYRFTGVLFASYGTPGGSPGSYTQGWCHSGNSYSVVFNSANMQTSVSISALNGVFGDPCDGTYKSLAVSLQTGLISSPPFARYNHQVLINRLTQKVFVLFGEGICHLMKFRL